MGRLALSLFLLHPHFLKIQLPTGGWEKSGFLSRWPRSRVLDFFSLLRLYRYHLPDLGLPLLWTCPLLLACGLGPPMLAGQWTADGGQQEADSDPEAPGISQARWG